MSDKGNGKVRVNVYGEPLLAFHEDTQRIDEEMLRAQELENAMLRHAMRQSDKQFQLLRAKLQRLVDQYVENASRDLKRVPKNGTRKD